MIENSTNCREQAAIAKSAIAKSARSRVLGTALTQIALAAALVISIVTVLAVAGVTGAVASTRSDIMVMDESTRFSTAAILAVILIVMGVLTVLALRDVAPASKRNTPDPRRNRR